jgi:uncharacterized membrane protein
MTTVNELEGTGEESAVVYVNVQSRNSQGVTEENYVRIFGVPVEIPTGHPPDKYK